MMKNPLAVSCALALFSAVASSLAAQSAVITFEQQHTADYATNGSGQVSPRPVVPLPPAEIQNGYAGLNWNGLYAINGALVPDAIDNNASALSVISGYNHALSYGATAEISSSSAFNLVSGYFNSLGTFNLNLEVQGYSGNTLMYDENFTLAPTDQSVLTAYFTNLQDICFSPQPLELDLNLMGVTDVRFTVSGGEAVRYNPTGGTLAMDDLLVSSGTDPVPEPGTLALAIGGGFAGWLLARRRRRL